MKHTTYDKRKGVSSILGTIIFIGIVFSTIVPMNLVMKQADNIYERTIHEVKMKDLEKANEELLVFAYFKSLGEGEFETDLTVFVRNTGANEVKVLRVWINDRKEEVLEISQTIAPKTLGELDSYDITDSESPLIVKVTTENGNIFTNYMGSIMYSQDLGWYTPSYAINVMIMNSAGQFKIEIWSDEGLSGQPYTGYYLSSGIDHYDILETFLVDFTGSDYYIDVKKRVGSDWIFLLDQQKITVPSVSGNPVIFVVVDGT